MGTSTTIQLSPTQTLTLQNVVATQLTAASFIGLTDYAHSTSNLNIAGTTGNDSIQSGSGNDTIDGVAGNDTLMGGAGNDLIGSSSGGNNIQNGEAGNDTLSSNAAYSDTLTGGTGNDLFIINGSATITDFEATNPNEKIDLTAFATLRDFSDLHPLQVGTSTTIQLSPTQTLTLQNVVATQLTAASFIGLTDYAHSTSNLTLSVTASGRFVQTGSGNDTIEASGGSDTIQSNNGNDSIMTDSGIHNSIDGGIGNDFIVSGNSTINGGDGADTILGSVNSIFVYHALTDSTLTAFDRIEGSFSSVHSAIAGVDADKLDFSGMNLDGMTVRIKTTDITSNIRHQAGVTVTVEDVVIDSTNFFLEVTSDLNVPPPI